MSRWACIVGRTLLPLAALSCTSSLDLGRFKKAEQTASSSSSGLQFTDVFFSAQGMTSHINEYFEVRIVDAANNVQAKAVYFGVTSPDFSISMPKAVSKQKPPYRIDYWADHNRSGGYDGVEGGINVSDHAWRRLLQDPLPDDVHFANNRYELDFVHDTVFTDIFTDIQGAKISGKDILLPFNLNIVGGQAFAGKMLEVQVTEQPNGRLVAIHRRGSVQDTYTAQVTGVCDEETNYEVTAFVDANGDGKYGPGDPSWKLELVSNNSGVTAELNVATAPQTPIVSTETGVVGGTTAP